MPKIDKPECLRMNTMPDLRMQGFYAIKDVFIPFLFKISKEAKILSLRLCFQYFSRS